MKKTQIMKLIFSLLILIMSLQGFCQDEDNRNSIIPYSFEQDTLFSTSLNENRALVIYKPSGYVSGEKCPLLVATDGQLINREDYLATIDSLIRLKVLPMLVIVGVFYNEKKIPPHGKMSNCFEYRNFEYAKDNCDQSSFADLKDLYYNHEHFFQNEVMAYLKNKEIDTSRKIFYGASNGGGFGITFSLRNPGFFSDVICMSTVGWSKIRKKSKQFPNYYLSYGDKELFIVIEENERLFKYLKKKKINYTSHVFNGGHDHKKWAVELIPTLKLIFKQDDSDTVGQG